MTFEQKYKKIKQLATEELQMIEENILSSIQIREPLNTQLSGFLSAPSKRVRPLLGILYTKASGYKISKKHIELLSAIEIVHNASLIHDDIIDNSDYRRGEKTISVQFGNKLGVITGDYLLALAMKKIATLNSTKIIDKFAQTLEQMCIGEINQNFDRFKIGTIKEYIEKSKNKTAYLFECTLTCCALLCEKPENTDIVTDFGINTGIAFQIRDDLQNVIARDNDLKPTKNDITEGIYTAPVIYSNDTVNYKSGIEKTKILLNNYIEKAASSLNKLPKNEYTAALQDFLELLNND